MSTGEILITRDKLQENLEDLYNYKIKPYLNGEGRTVIIRPGTVTKSNPSFTFTNIPTSYRYVISFFTNKQMDYINLNTSTPGQITITYDPEDFEDSNEVVNVYCRMEMVVINGAAITDFKITKPPRKLKYNTGYLLNLDKVVATAFFSDEVPSNVTTGTEFNPPNGTLLDTTGKHIVTATFHNFMDKFEIEVQDRKLITKYPFSYFRYGCAVVLNNEIHLLGGEQSQRMHYKFDGTNWISVSTLPNNFKNGCAVVYHDEIHILGGDSMPQYNMHYRYNGERWIFESNLPLDFYNGCAVVYNDKIHILGGSSAWTAHYSWDGEQWAAETNMPWYFTNGSAVVYNNEIHILGTYHTGGYTNHYAWDGDTWHYVSTIPVNMRYDSAVYCNVGNDNLIYIISNEASGYVYQWDGEEWSQIPTPSPYNFAEDTVSIMWNSGCEEDLIIFSYDRIYQYDEVSLWRTVQ